MTDFSWRTVVAGRPANEPLLLDATAPWSIGTVLAEMEAVRERLTDCRVLAVLADNSPAWAVADLAAQDAGIVHLPLPGFFSPAQLRHALEQTAADTILTDQPERIGALDLQFAITGTWRGLSWMRRIVDPVDMPAGTAKISFTSGSTGSPKGVCLSRQGLYDTANAVCARLADLPLERHLATLPLALLLENVAGVYAPLLRGMSISLPPLASLGWRGMAGFDPAALDAAVRTHDANSVILVPELLKAWAILLERSGQRAPEALRFAAVGGARVAPDLLRQARNCGIPAYEGYGLTECGSVVALNRPDDEGNGVGRPLNHAQIRIDGREVKVRTSAFLGYIGHPATAGAEFPTGDLGAIDERGHLHLSGRGKNLLITSYGRNIAPEWVEAALLAQPAILQAIVVGDGEPALSAVIVPASGVHAAEIDAAIRTANAGLPDYARIARHLLTEPFTVQNDLATGNGRPVRTAILERYAALLAALNQPEETLHAVL
jgi:long-subunit acyl-CoA synthetase (AMP-forming)